MTDQIELSPAQSLLEEMLRDALAHLYDAPQLQLHPLTQLLTHGNRANGPTRLTSHRLMLEAMERLRPLARIGAADPAWRPYFALHSRYVDGTEMAQIAEEQGVSMRQLHREHARGLAALASVVWTDFLAAPQRQQLEAMHAEPPLADAAAAHTLDKQDEAHADAPVQSHLDLELSRQSTGQATPTGISLHEAIDGVVAPLSWHKNCSPKPSSSM